MIKSRKLLTVDQLHEVCKDMVTNGCGNYLVGFYTTKEDSVLEELDWIPIKFHNIDIVENTLDLFP